MELPLLRIFFMRALPAAGTIFLTLIIPVFSDISTAADFFTGIALLYLLGIVSRLGLDLTTLKSASKKFNINPKTISSNEIITITLPLFSGSMIWAFSQWLIPEPLLTRFLWVFYALPAFSAYGMLSPYLRGSGMEIWAALTELGSISMLTTALIALQAVFNTERVTPSNSFIIASWSLYTINFLSIMGRFKFTLDKKVEFPNANKSCAFFLNQTSSYLTQWYPVFLFSKLDPNLVIYYSIANRMATIISFVGVTIDAYAAPRFSALWEQKSFNRLMELKATIGRYSMISAGAAFAVILLASTGYGLIIKYNEPYYTFVSLLLASYAISTALGPNGFFLMMTKHNNYATLTSLLCLLATIIMTTIAYKIKQEMLIVATASIVVLIKHTLFFRKSKIIKLP